MTCEKAGINKAIFVIDVKRKTCKLMFKLTYLKLIFWRKRVSFEFFLRKQLPTFTTDQLKYSISGGSLTFSRVLPTTSILWSGFVVTMYIHVHINIGAEWINDLRSMTGIIRTSVYVYTVTNWACHNFSANCQFSDKQCATLLPITSVSTCVSYIYRLFEKA